MYAITSGIVTISTPKIIWIFYIIIFIWLIFKHFILIDDSVTEGIPLLRGDGEADGVETSLHTTKLPTPPLTGHPSRGEF